jgi:hypothetical protein
VATLRGVVFLFGQTALPPTADDFTLALYLQPVVERSKSFAPVKSASTTIGFFKKVNLYNHLPTVGMVRQVAARKFGLTPDARKDPFHGAQVVAFAQAYGVQYQGYCHFVVASMAVIMFGAMCRYNDASRLRWRNAKLKQDGSCFHLTFEKRKNTKNTLFKQGNMVTMGAAPQGQVCPLKLLRIMQLYTGGEEDAFIFRGFNGRLVKKTPERTSPGDDYIAYG